ncbi:MAG: universal stress protein [Methanolobus sp.]
MNEINTILVGFSATSIHRKQAREAIILARDNKARLIILSVRDQNVSQMVANITKDRGFLGRDVVKKLAEDIKKDRDDLIEHRLAMVETEAAKRDIDFKTLKVKGDFEKCVPFYAKKFAADLIIVDASNKSLSQLSKSCNCEIRPI